MLFSLLLFLPFTEAAPPRGPHSRSDAFAELDGSVTLRFFNAVDGKPVSNAVVSFEGAQGRTDSEGAVRFPLPQDLSDGDDSRTAMVRIDGYVTASFDVHFMAGSLWFNRYSLSPSLKLGQLRFVLDWNEEPADLDVHLLKQDDYHISYRDTTNHQELAWLDRDDRDGHGPETITLNRIADTGIYRFYVHDYTNRQSEKNKGLAQSRAQVRIYSSSELIYQFSAPPDAIGTIWEVFAIENGKLRVVDEMK